MQPNPKPKLYEQDQALGIAVQQAKVADTPESFGQHMEHQALEELSTGETLDQPWPVVSLIQKVT
jgi:hypothetical protein